MIRLLLFGLLCIITISFVRFLRSLGRKPSQPKPSQPSRNRPAASPDEIVDVDYEEFDGEGDDREVRP